ncbi:MAG: putative transporter, permease protein [Acidimicrobiales bacterium]|nr:putative transporter, permease protein [Acidimicrobiales bacterium]
MTTIDLRSPSPSPPPSSATPTGGPEADGSRAWLAEIFRFRRSWIPSLVGIAVLLVVWQVVGLTVFSASGTVPPPTRILSTMQADGWDFYRPNIEVTLKVAAKGWAYGNLLAIIAGIVFIQVPLVERVLMQVAVASYCLPTIAIGGVLILALPTGDKPRVVLAALSCFFTTLVGMHVGLKSVDSSSLDLVRAYGGNSWTQLMKVRLRSCLPSLFAGLRIAAPAAMLGTIIGEWLGSENGLGVAMVNSQQGLLIERTWGIALTITALSAVAYGVTALAARLLTPWAPKVGR